MTLSAPGPHDTSGLAISDETLAPSASRVRIVVADDHAVVLKGLQQLLSEESDLELVATCADGAGCLSAVAQFRPDIVVLDLRMPSVDGLGVLREMRRLQDPTPVVLLTATITEPELIEAMRLGVRGVVLKEMAPKLLLDCLRKVSAGGMWVESDISSRALEHLLKTEGAKKRLHEQLTPRELEILKLVATGHSNSAIAEKLRVSAATVKSHIHSLYSKLGMSDRVQVTLFARENGIV